MAPPLLGLHHLTAIVDDPQENVDFYTNVLGLRLVKRTVNFDDPFTYHLYYGDERGRPGTLVTFFPWPEGRRGSRGVGQISAFAFSVPTGALAFWQRQLAAIGWRFSDPAERAGAQALSLYDPAGLLVELVERPDARRGHPSPQAEVPAILVAPDDVHVTTKKSLDSFLYTDLDALLGRVYRAETVVLAGINTDTCVYSTAFSTSNRGYQTVVISDCVASDVPCVPLPR